MLLFVVVDGVAIASANAIANNDQFKTITWNDCDTHEYFPSQQQVNIY